MLTKIGIWFTMRIYRTVNKLIQKRPLRKNIGFLHETIWIRPLKLRYLDLRLFLFFEIHSLIFEAYLRQLERYAVDKILKLLKYLDIQSTFKFSEFSCHNAVEFFLWNQSILIYIRSANKFLDLFLINVLSEILGNSSQVFGWQVSSFFIVIHGEDFSVVNSWVFITDFSRH